MANYPSDGSAHRAGTGGNFGRGDESNPGGNRYLPPLGSERRSPYSDQELDDEPGAERAGVTRAAAEMGSRMYSMVQRAATARKELSAPR